MKQPRPPRVSPPDVSAGKPRSPNGETMLDRLIGNYGLSDGGSA